MQMYQTLLLNICRLNPLSNSSKCRTSTIGGSIHQLLLGVAIGFLLSILLAKHTSRKQCPVEVSNTLPQTFRNVYSKPDIVDPAKLHFKRDVRAKSRQSRNQHLNNNKLVLIGVMTANKYVGTRAVAVYNTWATQFPGKIIFFTGGNSTGDAEDFSRLQLPLVALPDVDDSYPPQKKSFMMLKYMYDYYGDDYEWFLRADDDVYIHTEKLEDFLRSLNSDHLYFIGQAGRGNRAERGTLHLAHNENFCMGGPGNLFSHTTLRLVAPHVSECLKEMYTTHEDVELGRCVHRFTGVSCTWAYEMQSIFYHNSSGERAFTGNLKQRDVHRAITLHPVKNSDHLYRLHSYFQEREIDKRLYEVIQLQRELLFVQQQLKEGQRLITSYQNQDLVTLFDSSNITGLLPSLHKFFPSKAFDILNWSFIDKHNIINTPNAIRPDKKLDSASKEALQDVIRELMEIINSLSKVRGRVIEFKELVYGYHRVDPLHGEDFILDLLMRYRKYRGKKMTVPVRRHAYIQRPFAPLDLKGVSDVDSSELRTSLVFIVPLAGRLSIFERFLQNYEYNCRAFVKTQTNLTLVVVFFGSGLDLSEFQRLITTFKSQIRKNVISPEPVDHCQIKVITLDAEFSRAVGMEAGISLCKDNELLFLVDVDIVISAEAVTRVVLNTRPKAQVYFPIVFSEYSMQFVSESEEVKTAETFRISEDSGYWREYGYGLAAFYKEDFKKVTGFDTNIHGWGKEDVGLFEKFVQTNLTVFRSPDPEIIHIYHPIQCDPKLPRAQLEMCIGSHARTTGSWKNLINFVIQNQQTSNKFHQVLEHLFRN